MNITASGIYDLPEAVYHADPCATPSLSSHIINTLLTRSLFHAWYEHPKLNPAHQPEESQKFDLGSAAHALILEGENRMAVIRHPDYKKKKARELRDAARADGLHPVLEHQYEDIFLMRDAFLRAMAENTDLAGVRLTDGFVEKSLIWFEDGIAARARPDFMTPDRKVMLDLKTTAASAHPDAWVRTMLGMGADIQAAWYTDGNAMTGGPADGGKFIFGVQENTRPFAVSFIGIPPAFMAFAQAKVDEARRLWKKSMATNTWPAYPKRVCWVEPPAWATMAWDMRGLNPDEAEQGSYADPEVLFGDLKRAKESQQ